MNDKHRFVVSISVLGAAVSALSAAKRVEIPQVATPSEEIAAAITSALQKRQSAEQITGNLDRLAEVFHKEGRSLKDMYLDGQVLAANDADSSGSGGFYSCYTNCYTNCHSSRGWR